MFGQCVLIFGRYHGRCLFFGQLKQLALTCHLEGATLSPSSVSTNTMLSSKLFIPLIYLSLLVQSHELPLHRRDHGSIKAKRFLKNRSPADIFGSPPVVNAANLPTASSVSQTVAPTVSLSTASNDAPSTVCEFISFKSLDLTFLNRLRP